MIKHCPICGLPMEEGQEICLHDKQPISNKEENQVDNSIITPTTFLYGVMSFLCPIVGIILYFKLKNKEPRNAAVVKRWTKISCLMLLLLAIQFLRPFLNM